MGAYLDRLNEQYDEIRDGIEAVADRAADENRDVTETEQTQIDRDRERLGELQTAIEHYTGLETQANRVAELRRSVPAPAVQTRTARDEEPAYDLAREFPSAAHYAIAVHRAIALKDPDAVATIERATAHQTTADNPGIIPRPILGPVVNLLESSRPFINSISRRPLPAGKFDRPTVTQHVAVDVQAAEKDLTASQKLLIGLTPVTAKTWAGHLNISRQDVKWTSPGILQIVFDDFALIYSRQTDADACTEFVDSVTNTVPVASADSAGVNGALFGVVGDALTAGMGVPDTLWVSPDVWATLGTMTVGSNGVPAYPSISLTGASGAPLGLKMVVDGNFPAGTAIVGPSRYAEWYEDVDGLMQVQEPDVLGQLVGYAGFGAFVNAAPDAFTAITGVETPPAGP